MTDAAPTTRTSPPWWMLVVAALLVAGLAFAIGRFSAFGTSPVTTPSTTSADAGFARDMQVHHGQAVQMAMEIYRKTDDVELRTLSYDIATGQAAQRGEMYDWLVKWNLPQIGEPLMSWMSGSDAHGGHDTAATAAPTDEELHADMGMATDAELSELQSATGQEADCRFLELMIRHHEGAIPMAEALLELGSDPRALDVAASMKQTQGSEIVAMQSMQSRLGCSG